MNIFGQLRVTSNQVYHVIAWIECGESHLQEKSTRALQKLSKSNGKQVVRAIKIKIAPILSLSPMRDHALFFINIFFSECIFLIWTTSTYVDVTECDNYIMILNKNSIFFYLKRVPATIIVTDVISNFVRPKFVCSIGGIVLKAGALKRGFTVPK